jgi:hypothetical protein
VKVYVPRLRALLLMLIAHRKKRNLQPSEVYNHFKIDAKFVGFDSPQLAAIEKIKHLF